MSHFVRIRDVALFFLVDGFFGAIFVSHTHPGDFKMSSDQHQQEQRNEELEVLQSIYTNEELKVISNHVIELTLSKSIVLRVHLSTDYPATNPPRIEFIDTIFTDAMKHGILSELQNIWTKSQHQVCLYDWIEWLRHHESVALHAEATSTAVAHDEDALVEMEQKVTVEDNTMIALPTIFHGDTLTDRKSTFQAHVCQVDAVASIPHIMDALTRDRKVARATHNMMAYRIIRKKNDDQKSSAKAIVDQDYDDDGEHGAGHQLLRLLVLTKAENVLVVVSRWYGGILLGPDRFKHIMAVARRLLADKKFIS